MLGMSNDFPKRQCAAMALRPLSCCCDPALVTTPSFQCHHCLEWFPKVEMQKQHECPAKLPLSRLTSQLILCLWKGYGAALVTPQKRYIYTDGSGGHHNQGADWAAAVFGHLPTRYVLPDYLLLFGPVVTNRWDPNFLGAERGTNNTGELTAIGEARLWLLERSEERYGDPNNLQGLTVVPTYIYYDSEYARNMATRVRSHTLLGYRSPRPWIDGCWYGYHGFAGYLRRALLLHGRTSIPIAGVNIPRAPQNLHF